MKNVGGAHMHPQTQGKIERWHQNLKNRIMPANYFFEGEVEAAFESLIDQNENHRYQEIIGNLTLAAVYFGSGELILAEWRRIKHKATQNHRLNRYHKAAYPEHDQPMNSAPILTRLFQNIRRRTVKIDLMKLTPRYFRHYIKNHLVTNN
jgi:hypothetical protein